MKKILLIMIVCCPLFGMSPDKKGTKRKHEENSSATTAENCTIEQLRKNHSSLSDALLCTVRPYDRHGDEAISQITQLIVQQPDVDIRATNLSGQTALMRAAHHNLPKTMLVLLQAGAHIPDLRNMCMSSTGYKNTITDVLMTYKAKHEKHLKEAGSFLQRYLPVGQRRNGKVCAPLADLTLDYLRWPEDYSVTIPKSFSLRPKQLRF